MIAPTPISVEFSDSNVTAIDVILDDGNKTAINVVFGAKYMKRKKRKYLGDGYVGNIFANERL